MPPAAPAQDGVPDPGEETGPLVLVTGDEELLVDRAVARVVAAARRGDAETDVRDLGPDRLDLGDLLDLLAPSLFGSRRVVVLRDAQDLPREVTDALAAYATDPLDEVVLVVVHAGGQKGKGFADALRTAGALVLDNPRLRRPQERLDFLRAEVRRAGRTATPGALTALVDALGADLRELAAALDGLLEDTTGRLDEESVARYHRGRAVASGFVVADRALEGDAAGALELVRAGLLSGLSDGSRTVRPEGVPVVVVDSLARGVRAIARVAGSGGAPGEVARALGMAPFQVTKARTQARGWTPEGLRRAAAAVAAADGEVKGGAADPAYALERVVLAVVAARDVR